VDVYVLIDGVGTCYTLPSPITVLTNSGVRNSTFIPLSLFPPSVHLNLRNHRKILLIDSVSAYTGGMNIGDHHVADRDGHIRTTDTHFRLNGPIVSQLEQVFCRDWEFASGESLIPRIPPPSAIASTADSWARVITDGPDDDLGKLALVINSAISAATHSVRIMTPYFLPAREMIATLKSASLRGVSIDIVLPERSNLRIADWASRNLLWEILKWDVNVYYQPSPFAHTKLFIVDDTYFQVGSANLDPRSLRLNFEIAVEVVDETLASKLGARFDQVVRRSRVVTLDEVDNRSTAQRFRDSLAWLFTPYL